MTGPILLLLSVLYCLGLAVIQTGRTREESAPGLVVVAIGIGASAVCLCIISAADLIVKHLH